MRTGQGKAAILFISIIAILAILYGSHKIVSDGVVYYAQTESLVKDHDFDLTNQRYLSHQWKKIGIRPFANPDKHGAFYPGGTALFNAPFFCIADILDKKSSIIEEFNNNYFLILREKIPLTHSLAILFGGLVYLFFIFFLSYKVLYQQGVSNKYAVISIIFIGLSTPLMAHATIYPSWSHVIDTFLVTCAFFIFIKRDRIHLFNRNISFTLIGFTVGMAAFVRSFDVIFLIPHPLFVIWQQGIKQHHFKKMFRQLLLLAVGTVIPATLILTYNYTQYGSAFGAGHFSNPTFFAFYFSGLKAIKLYLRNLSYYLFNPVRGLIIYSPIALLSFWGIFPRQAKKYNDARFIAGFSIILALLGIANYNIFWAGGCFGQRFLTALFPFLGWGLFMLFQSVKKKKFVLLLAALFFLYSFIIFNFYIIYWNSGESRQHIRMAKYDAPISAYTPYDFVKVSWIAYKSEKLSVPAFFYHKVFLGNYREQLFNFLFTRPEINSKYFINTLDFALKLPANNEKKFTCVPVIEDKKRALRVSGSGSISYYLKIPEGAHLSLFIKTEDEAKEKKNSELKITIQDSDTPEEKALFTDVISAKKYKKWQHNELSLSPFSGKITKFSLHFNTDKQNYTDGYLYINPQLTVPLTRAFSAKRKDYFQKIRLAKDKIKETNIIIIAFDTLSAEDLGCYTHKKSATPHIDKFSQGAVLFENAHTAATNTAASMASLFTAAYPLTHRLLTAQHSLNPSLNTLAEVLQDNKYHTYGAGFTLNSLNKGFQTKFTLQKKSQDEFAHSLHRFLSQNFSPTVRKPAYVYVLLRLPKPQPDKRRKVDKNSELLFLDNYCSVIVQKLKEFGIYDKSIIVLTAHRGQTSKMTDDTGDKRIIYNKRNSIPLIIRLPEYFGVECKRVAGIAENIDVMPTLLQLLNINDKKIYLQGKSMLPLILGTQSKIKESSITLSDGAFILTDLKYEFVDAETEQRLYNIKIDSMEERNLADDVPLYFHYYRTLSSYYKRQLIDTPSKNGYDIRFDRKVEKELGSLGYIQ
jgi:arylsulfatase A-like enzyme